MRKLTLTLVPLLLLACGREPAAPAIAERPRFNFSNNPDNGNPRVVRFEDVFGFVLIDETRGLFSVQAATDRQFRCNGRPTLYTFADVQYILHNPDDPTAASRIHELEQARRVFIAVYEDYAGWESSGFDCADLLARKVAQGSGNLTNTDNDLLGLLSPNSANAFGFVAQGQLQWVDGGAAHYNGIHKCMWDGGEITSVKCVDRINLR